MRLQKGPFEISGRIVNGFIDDVYRSSHIFLVNERNAESNSLELGYFEIMGKGLTISTRISRLITVPKSLTELRIFHFKIYDSQYAIMDFDI